MSQIQVNSLPDEELYVLAATLLAGVKDIHSLWDTMTEEQWQIAERLCEEMIAELDRRRTEKIGNTSRVL